MNATQSKTAETIKMPRTKEGFELQVCSRCGGGGKYSYCQMYGDVCFKCHGSGHVYTKRGLSASLFYAELLKKPVCEVKPGDIVYVDGISGFSKSGFSKVNESKADENNPGMWIIDSDLLRSTTNATDKVRVGHSSEFKTAAAKQAREYQSSLTKMGKPRK